MILRGLFADYSAAYRICHLALDVGHASALFVLRDASQAMVTHFAVTISSVWPRKAGAVSAQKVKSIVANYADL